jgi:hypothetical protein
MRELTLPAERPSLDPVHSGAPGPNPLAETGGDEAPTPVPIALRQRKATLDAGSKIQSEKMTRPA